MKKFGDFSTNNTQIHLEGDIIKKRITLQPDRPIKEIYNHILTYIEKIKQANLPFPELFSHSCENNELKFNSQFQGYNLFQKTEITNPKNWFEQNKIQIKAMLSILKQAQDNNLDLDPHIKNFVINPKGEIHYVDFFPPPLEDYYKLRLNLETQEKELLTDLFQVYSYKTLGIHFFADLIKEDLKFMDIAEDFYTLIKDMGFHVGTYDEFLETANKIKTTELKRVEKDLNLL